MRHNHDDPTACWCRPTRVGPSGRDEWIHHDLPVAGRNIWWHIRRLFTRCTA